MTADQIPIQNIYFLLCYAWNHLQEKKYAQVRCENCDKIWDLLAKIMVRGSQQLVKRGLHRNYVTRQELRVRPKGKILVSQDVRRPVLSTPTRTCEFAELDSDVLPNQIVAATFERLKRHSGLTDENRRGVRESAAVFSHCSRRSLSQKDFRRVTLNGNMRHYRFILNVCELIHSQSLGTTESGAVRFRDFDRDEATMGRLFEKFVRSYYEKEQTHYRVTAPMVEWDLDPDLSTSRGMDFLPAMRTDICLESGGSKLIIDCKFYRDLFQHQYANRKFVSGNLYQLFCYLRNQSVQPGWSSASGILLYPTNEEQIDERVNIQGHEIRIATINLNQDWTRISRDLLRLIGLQ